MSYPMTHLGGRPFNPAFTHPQANNAEAEYDRLRSLARQEAGKRSSCLDRSHKAYERGDGAAAHELSEEGKRHGAMMDQFNRQASDYIFRENNAVGRVEGDTIDLHGQYVEEAERILEQRIRVARGEGQNHLHVIVGKGNHSPGHIQKIKPKVEQICHELGLQYTTEPNAGRMYINLQGGPAVMPAHLKPDHHGGQGQYHGAQQQHQQQQQYHGGQQQSSGGYQGANAYPPMDYQQQQQGAYQGQQQQQQQQQDPNAEIEAQVKKYLPRILRMCQKQCCTVM